jgi:hypothetical protein
MVKRFVAVFLCAVCFLHSFAVLAATQQQPNYEDKDIQVRLIFRKPEQLAAFYIGRGFKQDAINKIQETCFITAIIKNSNIDVLWLELDNWTFRREGQAVTRIDRSYWKQKWQEIKLPMNHQSTFGWTLLPEVRDLRRDESVGGNVVIPKQPGPFNLTMRFKTGTDKKGGEKIINFQNISCASE